MPKVEFHFDFGSPNAYLAHLVIPEIEDRTGTKFEYVPVLLGGVYKLTGNRSPAESFAGIKNKPDYARLETEGDVDGRGAAARVPGARPQAGHRRQRGRTRALDLSPLCRTRLGPVVEGRARSPGSKSKSWTSAAGRVIGGKPFSRGALYLMLRNRTYRGEIVHKGQSHPGEHTPPRERVVRPTTRRKVLQGVNKIKLPQRARRPSDNEQGRFVGRKQN